MKLQALAAAAALLTAGSAGLASAQTAPPVAVITNDVFPASFGATRNSIGTADITFVNESNQPATEVDLALVSHGSTLDTYRDVGTFAPGVAIHHTWGTNAVFRDQQVEVAAVKFADGSTWTNDETPLPRLQAAYAGDVQ